MTWNDLLVEILSMTPDERRENVDLFDYEADKDRDIVLNKEADKIHFTTG